MHVIVLIENSLVGGHVFGYFTNSNSFLRSFNCRLICIVRLVAVFVLGYVHTMDLHFEVAVLDAD